MNNRFYWIVVLMLISAYFHVGAVLGQENPVQSEQELIDFVAQAFGNTRAVDSMAAEMEQTMKQYVGGLGLSSIRTLTQNISGKITFNDGNSQVEMTIKRAFSLENINSLATSVIDTITESADIISAEGGVYVRIRDTASEDVRPYLDRWAEIRNSADGIPGLEMSNIEQFIALMTIGLHSPVTTTVVRSIHEMDAEEIDGQTMRVFDISLDWDRMGVTGRNEFALLGYLMEELGTESEAELDMMVWIGQADGLVHRMDIDVNIEHEIDRNPDNDTTMDIVHITENDRISYRFSQFNQSFEVEVPDLNR